MIRYGYIKNISRRFDRFVAEICDKRLKLSFFERALIKIYVWHRLYQRLCRIYIKSHCTDGMASFYKQESQVTDENLIPYLLHDIIVTGECTLEGVATYTRIPLDALIDLSTGINANPSLDMSKRIIGLHISAKRSRYNILIRKLLQCLEAK